MKGSHVFNKVFYIIGVNGLLLCAVATAGASEPGWTYHPKKSWEYHPRKYAQYVPKEPQEYRPRPAREYHPKQSWEYHPRKGCDETR
jgi:hypothetical protein